MTDDAKSKTGFLQALASEGPLGGGNLRAAVMGVNDGLISNFSIVMGVAGGLGDPTIVMLAGIAGLLAGGFSMAAGEYISVTSQRDVYLHQIRQEKIRLRERPAEEESALADFYQDRGLTAEESQAVARRVMSDPETALRIRVRHDLGLDLNFLGSPWGAAFSSFAAFIIGAIIPLVPYLANLGELSFYLSAALSAAALLAVGAMVAVGSGRNPAWGAARMLLVGSLAAAVTFGIGRVVGIAALGT